tara:strand:+ start:478 stop:765 length:288 start_codon:yes stop_codon:yes gene_type:complete
MELLDEIDWDVSPTGKCRVLDLIGRQIYVCLKDKVVIETIADIASSTKSNDVFRNKFDSPNGFLKFTLNDIRQCLIYTDEERAYFKKLYEGYKNK